MKRLRQLLDARVFLLVITLGLWSVSGTAYWYRGALENPPSRVEGERSARRREKLKRLLPADMGDAVEGAMESSDRVAHSLSGLVAATRELATSFALFGTIGCALNLIPAVRRRIWSENGE